MFAPEAADRKASLHEVRVDSINKNMSNRTTYGNNFHNSKNSGQSDFGYVNNAYVGSTNSVVGDNEIPVQPTVYKEQYWACSRWPYSQRILAIAVGVLLGAVIGLAVTIALKDTDAETIIGGIFRSSTPG